MEHRYFTFPVELLRGAFSDIEGVCSDIISYAVYITSLQLNSGSMAMEFYGLPKQRDAYDKIAERGRVLHDSFHRPALASVKTDIVFEFRDNQKTEFEIAVFTCFCGLRSIIGTKPCVKTNNAYLIARMFGFKSVEEFEQCEPKPPYYQKHFSTAQSIRYQLTEKIINNELEPAWGLAYYSSHMRGFYASFDIGIKKLAKYAKDNRKSVRLKKFKDKKNEIIKEVQLELSQAVESTPDKVPLNCNDTQLKNDFPKPKNRPSTVRNRSLTFKSYD